MAEETHGDARVYDCVVIGAGLAGMQAARRLHDGGLSGASTQPVDVALP
jgi:cation diffusion facilitator CzcD-associated flavoprotein CzcO